MTVSSPLSKKVMFAGAYGYELAAVMELPLHPPRAYALFAHCFTCSKESLAAYRISKALTAFGIAVLRFDFTGLGGSQGDFANTNFSGNINDLLKAADFLRADYQAPQLLIGHSLGGAAVLAAAGQIAEASAVVTLGAPSDLVHLKRFMTKAKLDQIQSEGEAEVELGGRHFHIKNQFLKDLDAQNLLQRVAHLDKALLVCHSAQDEIVDIDNAYAIFNAARQSKSFITLEDANHLLTRKEDAAYVSTLLADWASRYLPQPPSRPADKNQAQVVVSETGEGRFTQEISIGEFTLKADEPAASGGNDSGPGPYDFLLAALGACTSMTLRLYAELKKMPLDHIAVALHHNKVYADDCKNCESDKAKVDRIDVSIDLQGELSEEQRAKLLEIANKCPVHRTLTSTILIDTRLYKSVTHK